MLTALALVLTWLPSAAIAAESSGAAPDSMGIERGYREEHVSVPDAEDLPSNDELFAGYVDSLFHTGISEDFQSFRVLAGDRLTGVNKTLYGKLKDFVTQIAAAGGSTEKEFTPAELGIEKVTYTNTELGISGNLVVDKDGKKTLADGAMSTILSKMFDDSAVVNALMVDCPYELYWFDKTRGWSSGIIYSFTTDKLTEITVTTISFTLNVAQEYAKKSGGGYLPTEMDSAIPQKVTTAKTKASEIVSQYAGKTNFEILDGYRQEICDLVEYNEAALAPNYPYGDPWQLIYVFDGDTNTKVVCEGYAKAFQYLCDLTSFTGTVECYTVTGLMDSTGGSATGAGPHMWNIVTLDGSNYLVDITNCDGNSIGRPNLLFLAGSAVGDKDSINDTKNNTIHDADFSFPGVSDTRIHYKYDADQSALWGEDVLKLAEQNYSAQTIIAITGIKSMPDKTEYEYGDTFEPAGLILDVTYSDNTPGTLEYKNNNMTFTVGTGDSAVPLDKFTECGDITPTVHYESLSYTLSVDPSSGNNITVTPKDLSKSGVAVVTLNPTSYTYDGTVKEPAVTVKIGETTLTKDTDYTVTYENNTNAGTATVNVTGKDNYTGMASETFTIAKATPELGMVSLAQGTVVYEATVPGDVSLTRTNTTVDGTLKLTSPANFTGKGGQNVSCTWTFTPADTANYETVTGTISVPVTARSVASIAVTTQPTNTSYEYGAPFNPAGLVLSVTYNDSETPVNVPWTEGCGMTFSPETLGDVGSKTVTVTYGNRTAEIQVTVTQKTLTVPADVAWDTTGSPFTYDGEEKSVPLKNEDKIPVELTVTKTGDTGTNAGDYTAKATFALKEGYTAGNYTISASVADAEWTINKADLTGKNASIHVKFDDTVEKIIAASAFGIKEAGTFALKAEGSVTGTGLADNYPSFGEGIKVKLADGLTADSKGDITIPVTFTATNTNYNPIDLTLTVSVTDKTVTEVTAAPFEKTYDGSAVTLAELTANLTATSGGEAVAGEWKTTDELPVNAGDYSLTMTFTPTEAEAYTEETVVISVTIKKAAATVTADDKTITAGDPLPEYTWTVAPAGVATTNTPVASCEATSSSPAGTYPITVTGDEVSADGNYTITYVNGTLTIEAAVIPEPPVIHVTGVSLDQNVLHLTVGGTAQLVASVAPGNAGNRNVTWSSSEPAVAAVSGGAVTALRPGSAVITVTTVDGGYAASCAVTVTAPVTPPVNPGNPGGGYPTTPVTPVVPNTPSNPGTSNNNNNNSSTNNPGDSAPSTPSNSSVAPEATVSGGTASAVVSGDMASQLVDQAASGVSTVVIAPEISGSVNRTEVSIPASAVSGIAGGSSAALKVETPAANITISNSGLASLGGQDVTIAAEKTGGTVSVEITAGGQTVSSVTGGLKVEIPADCGPGTVAQLVDENGNVLSTLRKSYASGQTMNVPLEGSAKVIFVDNGKSFADVPAGNWAANAVAFASGHELMNGVSASSFSPAEPMTRGMLAVVLHNLEGNPGASYSGSFGDVGGNDWYAQAVQWAADNSIVTGVSDGVFAPNASITREQLVVMLYRYAGEPNAGGSLTGFSDSANVSSWAQQAMAWAVSSGIVGGSNGALNPQSGATRAEVAQMLMNFVTTGEI